MLNKQNEKLLQELLKKYKQGIISGLYPGNNITFTPTGCRDKIISSTGGGAGGGIQSIQEGDNITVDNTDPLNPIVSASSGGSPGGSQYNVQINNGAGGFSGSNNFIWSPSAKTLQVGDVTGTGNQTKLRLTDANNLFEIYGLRNTIPPSTTTPVFTGSGSDDILVTGSGYSGVGTTNYTITIDGTNKDFINFPTSSISGSGFTIGEIVTSSSGGSATIDAINLNSDNSYENLVLSSVTGTFLQFDVITGGTSSTTATLDADLAQQDTYTWTDGATTISNVICKTPGSTLVSNGVLVNFDTGTGHTLTDNWTFDGVPGSTTYGKMLNLDGANKTVDIGDVDGITGGMDIRFNNSYTFPKLDGTSGQALVTDGAGNVSFQDVVQDIFSIKVTVPSADILAVVTGPTPYQLIPAPGAGKFIDVISIVCNLNFNTTAYDFNNVLRIGTNTTGSTLIGTDGGQLTISPYNMINASATKLSVVGSGSTEKNVNTALYLNAGSATTVTTGDSDIDLYITYKIVTL